MGSDRGTTYAQPLDPRDAGLPETTQEILEKGKQTWLKNTEVCDMLINHAASNLRVAREPPCQPPGGSLFLFDRKAVRFFRKDNHNWRKKADGKTVRETHEKLKVGNVDMLNCYYAHADRSDGLQRRCYWLLESEDDIVLVHYLNIAQRQQAGRSSSRLAHEDATTQLKHNDRDSDSSPSDPATSQDLSKSSDAADAATNASSVPASRAENGTHGPSNAVESGLAGPMPSETLLGLLPSLPSMDMFFNTIDSKLSTERLSAYGGEDAVRSNAAVQELLRSWEEEQHPNDLPAQAYSLWQQKHQPGMSRSVLHPAEAHNQLIAASTSTPAIDPMQQDSNSSWSASNYRPPLAPNMPHRVLDDSKSCTYPGAYMHLAEGAQSSDNAFQAQQLHQPQPLHHHSSAAPPRNLAETQSAPPTAALDFLSGFGLGSATDQLHRLRQQSDNNLTANQARRGDQLADYMARTRGRGIGSPRGTYDSSITWPGSLTTQPQLQTSFPMSSASHQPRSALGESALLNAFSMPRSRPQAMVQNAFSQAGLHLGPRARLQSPFGFPPVLGEGLPPVQEAFDPSVASSSLGQPTSGPRGLTHQQSVNNPRSSLSFPVMSRGDGTSSISPSSFLPGEAAAMDVCQNSSQTAPLQASPGAKRRSSAMSLSEQVSQGFAVQPQGRSGRPWRRLPSRASAPSPFAPGRYDSSSGQEVDLPTFQGQLQAQPSQLQRQPSQEPLHPNGPSISRADDDMPDASPWFSQPDAMREAALLLNVQLAQVDKQVLEHIVPLCGHGTGSAPEQSDSHIIAQQVSHCEDQLRQLEIGSQQLLQASDEQVAAMRAGSDEECSQGAASAGRPAWKRKVVRRMSDASSSKYLLYDTLECGPPWGYPHGGAEVLLVAKALDDAQAKDTNIDIHAMFDRTEVPVTELWPGVMRCIAPAHAIGAVRLCLTLGDGRPCSKAITFEYKSGSASRSCNASRPGVGLSDKELQLQLLQALLQSQPDTANSSSNTRKPNMSVPTSVTTPKLGPMQGLLLGEAPAAALNRSQLMQALFRLELNTQTPQGQLLHGPDSGQPVGYPPAAQANPALLNSISDQGLALLHLAAGLGYDWACNALITNGADVQLADAWGLTALHWAANRGHEACIVALITKGSDPTCLTHSQTTESGTAADLASSAGHVGIAAFLAEVLLVHVLAKAQTGKPPSDFVSLLDWQQAQNNSVSAAHTEPTLQRKRYRIDPTHADERLLSSPLATHHDPPPPASQLISSAREASAPSISIVVRRPTAQPPQGEALGPHEDSHHSSSHFSRGSFQHSPMGRAVEEPTATAVVAAAKQAVVMLEQQWPAQAQPGSTDKRQEQSEGAFRRLADSSKMWSTLQKIAEAELADSTNQAADSITLRFLSLAPRIAQLNEAVRHGLMSSGHDATAAAEADTAAEAAGGQAGDEIVADGSPSEAPTIGLGRYQQAAKQKSVKFAEDGSPSKAAAFGPAHLKLAVQHIEAMVGNAEACAQYDRLVKAVKGSSLRNTSRRVMPALHSY